MNAYDVIGAIFLLLGCTLTLIASIGMYRYSDLITKQHVATKPQVVALILNLAGTALLVREATMTWTMVLVIMFMLITAPISAHMLSRAGYRTGRVDYNALVEDDLGDDLQAGEFSGEK